MARETCEITNIFETVTATISSPIVERIFKGNLLQLKEFAQDHGAIIEAKGRKYIVKGSQEALASFQNYIQGVLTATSATRETNTSNKSPPKKNIKSVNTSPRRHMTTRSKKSIVSKDSSVSTPVTSNHRKDREKQGSEVDKDFNLSKTPEDDAQEKGSEKVSHEESRQNDTEELQMMSTKDVNEKRITSPRNRSTSPRKRNATSPGTKRTATKRRRRVKNNETECEENPSSCADTSENMESAELGAEAINEKTEDERTCHIEITRHDDDITAYLKTGAVKKGAKYNHSQSPIVVKEVESPITNFKELAKDKVLYITSSGQYQCTSCGYISDTLMGTRGHIQRYHVAKRLTCEICFSEKSRAEMKKHVSAHFDLTGRLLPNAIIIHQIKLKELGIQENLTGDLLEQIQNASKNDQQNQLVDEKRSSVSAIDVSSGNSSPKNKFVPVECPVCAAQLSHPRFLKAHMRRVHAITAKHKMTPVSVRQAITKRENLQKEGKYSCPKCAFFTFRIQNFNSHLKSHEQPDFFYCDVEGCSYKNKAMAEIRRHNRNAHAEKTIQCPHCPIKFRTQPQLTSHIKTKHTKEYGRMCEICGKTLSSFWTYKKHKEAHHGDPGVNPGDRILCPKCGRVYRTMGAFYSHQRKYHTTGDEKEELKEEPLVSDGLNVLQNGQMFECKHCQAFKNSSARAVRQHIIRVHLEKKFCCNHCDTAFSRKGFLLKHIAVHHLGLEAVECLECGKSFKNKSYLSHHQKRMHLRAQDSPAYQCDVCYKCFIRKGDYEKHSELHKPEEDRKWEFKCEMCDKAFRFKSNLEYHMLEHTGVKAFQCGICGKSFKTQSILNTHLPTHSDMRPFECMYCGKTFKTNKYLDVHLLTHTGNSFSCQACCRIFPHQDGLGKHVCKAIKVDNTEDIVTEYAEQTPHIIHEQAIDNPEQFVISEEVLVLGEEIQQLSSTPGTEDVKQGPIHMGASNITVDSCDVTEEDLESTEPGEIEEILNCAEEYFVLKQPDCEGNTVVYETMSTTLQPKMIEPHHTDQSLVAPLPATAFTHSDETETILISPGASMNQVPDNTTVWIPANSEEFIG